MNPCSYRLVFCFLGLLLFLSWASQTSFADDNSFSAATPANPSEDSQNSASAPTTLILHKPAPDPSWGKVIQFQEQQSAPSNDKPDETLYRFLFQDSNGIVRIATYHENSTGNGYWEVLVWDLP